MTVYALIATYRVARKISDLETFMARITPLERMTIEGNIPGFIHAMEAFVKEMRDAIEDSCIKAGAAGLHTQWVPSWLGNQSKSDLKTANVEIYRMRVDILKTTQFVRGNGHGQIPTWRGLKSNETTAQSPRRRLKATIANLLGVVSSTFADLLSGSLNISPDEVELGNPVPEAPLDQVTVLPENDAGPSANVHSCYVSSQHSLQI